MAFSRAAVRRAPGSARVFQIRMRTPYLPLIGAEAAMPI
jgi:hypothetical protein